MIRYPKNGQGVLELHNIDKGPGLNIKALAVYGYVSSWCVFCN